MMNYNKVPLRLSFWLESRRYGISPLLFNDAIRNLFHLREQLVCVFFCFFPARDFIAGFVPLGLELLGRGNQFSPLLIQRSESVEIQDDPALLRHIGKDIQMVTEITQIMHRLGRITEEELWSRLRIERLEAQLFLKVASIAACGSSVGRKTVPGLSMPSGARSAR